MTAVDRLVVGAGLSGLAYAWWARLRGERVLVLEASERVGGVLRTDEVEGGRGGRYLVERAAGTVASGTGPVARLLDSLPERPALLPAGPAARRQYVLVRRGLVEAPRSPRGLLSGGLLPRTTAFRLLAEVLRGPARGLGPATLSGFVRARLGERVEGDLLLPFTRGVYGASPVHLGAADAFPALVALERRRGGLLRGIVAERGAGRAVHVVEGGMEALPRALARALGESVRLSTRVTAVRPGGPDEPAAVLTADGETFHGAEVCLAVPARRQADLLEPFARHHADVLRQVPTAPIAVAAVGLLPRTAARVPQAFGFLRGRGARARILGATFRHHVAPDAAPQGHGLVLTYLGGTEDPGALDLDDRVTMRTVETDLARALRAPIEIDAFDVCRWPEAVPLAPPGHRGRMASIAASLASHRIRLLASHVTGVGLDRCASAGAPLRAPLPERAALV
jgi:oxygen-dependent protoporphyrinogen oxidase